LRFLSPFPRGEAALAAIPGQRAKSRAGLAHHYLAVFGKRVVGNANPTSVMPNPSITEDRLGWQRDDQLVCLLLDQRWARFDDASQDCRKRSPLPGKLQFIEAMRQTFE
jgi:hypothetical protein